MRIASRTLADSESYSYYIPTSFNACPIIDLGAEAAAAVLGSVGRAADTEGCVCGRGAAEVGRLGTVAAIIFDGRAVGVTDVARGRCGEVTAIGRVVADAVAVARGRVGTVPDVVRGCVGTARVVVCGRVGTAPNVVRGCVGTAPDVVRGRVVVNEFVGNEVVVRGVCVLIAVVRGVLGVRDVVVVAAVGRRVCRTFMALLGGNTLATLCEN